MYFWRLIMGLLSELREENKKSGLFDSHDLGFSYRLGVPVLDQNLGSKQRIKTDTGEIIEQVQLGVPAGTITIFAGPPSSGKTTQAIQSAWNIVSQFGEDATVEHYDKERSMTLQRVKALTGATNMELNEQYHLDTEDMTFEGILERMSLIGIKKQSDPDRFKYNTGFKDIFGHDIIHYVPTVVIVDSLMGITSRDEKIDELDGSTDAMRRAQKRGNWLRDCTELCGRYNINMFIINHIHDQVTMPGKSGAKQLVYMPSGKVMPGGEKVLYYITSLIVMIPRTAKDTIKTAEDNGYYGSPINALVSKSRSSRGGTVATLELVQDSGFDPKLTLKNFAKSRDLIQGRNPKCYFKGYEDVKFDDRIFVTEMENNPELIRTLFKVCKPELDSLIPDAIDDDDTDILRSPSAKINDRNLMKEFGI